MIISHSRGSAYVQGLTTAKVRGRYAYLNGLPITACPYKRFEHRQCWEEGWNAQAKETAAIRARLAGEKERLV